jgi:hypothetical protein
MTNDDFWSRTNAVRWSDSKPLEEDPKTFWDGMNSSLEEAFQTNAEIYKECIDNEHAAVIILAQERWVPAICSKCLEKLENFE